MAGRLGYGVLLLAVSDVAEDDVQRVLRWLSLTSWLLVAFLALTAVIMTRRPDPPPVPTSVGDRSEIDDPVRLRGPRP